MVKKYFSLVEKTSRHSLQSNFPRVIRIFLTALCVPCLAMKPHSYPLRQQGLSGNVTVSSEMGRTFSGINLMDGNIQTAWMPDTSDSSPSIVIEFARKVKFSGCAIEFGWKKSENLFLSTELGVSGSAHYVVSGYSDSTDVIVNKNAEEEFSVCSPNYPLDGNVKKRFSRMDVIAKKFEGNRLIIRTSRPISDIRFLTGDSISRVIYPDFLRSIFVGKGKHALQGVAAEEVCKRRDSSFYRCHDYLPKKKIVRMCSPSLAVKSNLENIWRIIRSPVSMNPVYRLYKADSGFEAWLPASPWEIEPGWDAENYEVPKSARWPLEGESQNERFSYPVFRMNQNGVVDSFYFRDRFEDEMGPEERFMSSLEQTELIDTVDSSQDTSSIRIGKQKWMKSNVTNSVVDSRSLCWGMSIRDTGKTNRNCFEYGRLYRWKDAKSACPIGWRLPKKSDWVRLDSFVRSQKSPSISKGTPGLLLLGVGKWNREGDSSWDPFGFNAKMARCPPEIRRLSRSFRRIAPDAPPAGLGGLEFHSFDRVFVDDAIVESCGSDSILNSFSSSIFWMPFREDQYEMGFLRELGLKGKNPIENPRFPLNRDENAFLPVRCISEEK
ncbi:MAG: hypothetical protein IPO40_03715 [Fibrobacteres bacterium]|nr:hypothetical protein [Fibrobacterota bacterium]